MITIEQLRNSVNDLTEEACLAPGKNDLNNYNKLQLLEAIEELERFRAGRVFKKLDFKQSASYIYEAEGVNCCYRIQCKDGRCYAIKSVYNAGPEEPVVCATFNAAETWCQRDFDTEVGKFLQNP